MNQLTQYFFWFTQPGSVLSDLDWLFGYKFLGLLVLGIILLIAKRFVAHPVVKKLLGKIQSFSLTISIFGLIWFGFRYEVTPIFARRFWAGLIMLVGLAWLAFIVKYLIVNFPKEKSEYSKLQLKNKYLPKK